MSFDHTTATPEELEARLIDFRRKAPKMNMAHFAKVLDSFPLASQDAVLLAVQGNGPTDFFRVPPPIASAPAVPYVDSSGIAAGLLDINNTLKDKLKDPVK